MLLGVDAGGRKTAGAYRPAARDNLPVIDWQSLAVSVLMVGILALILRWAYGGRSRSVVARRAKPGAEDEYGLLVSIASPGTYI